MLLELKAPAQRVNVLAMYLHLLAMLLLLGMCLANVRGAEGHGPAEAAARAMQVPPGSQVSFFAAEPDVVAAKKSWRPAHGVLFVSHCEHKS
jgi:hypothetical protein